MTFPYWVTSTPLLITYWALILGLAVLAGVMMADRDYYKRKSESEDKQP